MTRGLRRYLVNTLTRILNLRSPGFSIGSPDPTVPIAVEASVHA